MYLPKNYFNILITSHNDHFCCLQEKVLKKVWIMIYLSWRIRDFSPCHWPCRSLNRGKKNLRNFWYLPRISVIQGFPSYFLALGRSLWHTMFFGASVLHMPHVWSLCCSGSNGSSRWVWVCRCFGGRGLGLQPSAVTLHIPRRNPNVRTSTTVGNIAYI